MKYSFLLFLFIFSNAILSGQPSIQWQQSLGGTSIEYAFSIQQTTDSGYIVAGASSSNNGDVSGNHGAFDCWIMKLTNTGSLQWQKCLGGSGSEYGNAILQTTDGGYIVASTSNSTDGDVSGNHGFYDCWIAKLNNLGTIQWEKSFGGTDIDYVGAIQQTNDGGYVFSGYTASNDSDVSGNHGYFDFWVVKMDSLGTLLWQKCLGGTDVDETSSIQQTADSGYIIAGISLSTDGDVTGNHNSTQPGDYWVVKLNNAGIMQWQKCLGGTGYDAANAVQQTKEGGFIVAGYSTSNDSDVSNNHGMQDYWVVKLSTTGTIQWQKSLGGSNSENATSILQTSDSGYIVAGYTESNDSNVSGNHGDLDYWILKLDQSGTMQWEKCLGGTMADYAIAIRQSPDDGYIVAGYSRSNNGDVSGNHGTYDSWIVKLSSFVGIEEINSPLTNVIISPNPIFESAIISFTLNKSENINAAIYDVTGKLIKNLFSGKLNPGCNEIKWNLKDDNKTLATGVYFLSLQMENFSQSFKLIVVN